MPFRNVILCGRSLSLNRKWKKYHAVKKGSTEDEHVLTEATRAVPPAVVAKREAQYDHTAVHRYASDVKIALRKQDLSEQGTTSVPF